MVVELADTSLRGFNEAGNVTLVPVQCAACKNVTRVFSRNVSWLCPFCGAKYTDVERHMIGKDRYRHYKQIVDRFSIARLQRELWCMPDAGVRSANMIGAARRGRI